MANESITNLGLYGQLVIGPPGSGKTTYCSAMYNFLTRLGRKVAVINFDPANDFLPYPCAINLSELMRLDDVMDYHGLGPNGGLIYCMESLYNNRDWLAHRLFKLKKENSNIYLIFDLPGQVELYTHYPIMRNFVSYLTNKSISHETSIIEGLGLQLTSVHLVDSHYCSDASKFIACVLTSLAAMLQLSLPHVNILSKIDLLEQFGSLDFSLDFFTEVLDLNYLIDRLHEPTNPLQAKFAKFNAKLIELIQDRSLVQYIVLDIQDDSHLERVMRFVDRANGYVFGPTEQHSLHNLTHLASGVELAPDWIGMAEEKYTNQNSSSSNVDVDFFT